MSFELKNKSKHKVTTGLYIDTTLLKKIEELAEQKGLKRNEAIVQLIEIGIAAVKDSE